MMDLHPLEEEAIRREMGQERIRSFVGKVSPPTHVTLADFAQIAKEFDIGWHWKKEEGMVLFPLPRYYISLYGCLGPDGMDMLWPVQFLNTRIRRASYDARLPPSCDDILVKML